MRPPVSALMPVRDGEEWICRSLENVNRILKDSDELIIIDDGSTDNTTKLIKNFQIIPSLSLIESPPVGLVAALNLGLEIAKNDWVVRFDVDDQYDSQRLDFLFHQIGHETVAVFSDYQFRKESNESLGQVFSPIMDHAIKLSLYKSQRTAHPSVMYRKAAVRMAGSYLAQDFPCEDLSLWFRLAKLGDFESRDKVLLSYTLTRKSISANNRQLIQEKHAKLANQFRNEELVKKSVAQLAVTLKKYETYSYPRERRLLHILDFFDCNNFSLLSLLEKGKLLIYLFFEILNFKTSKSLVKLFYEKTSRRRYRKNAYSD